MTSKIQQCVSLYHNQSMSWPGNLKLICTLDAHQHLNSRALVIKNLMLYKSHGSRRANVARTHKLSDNTGWRTILTYFDPWLNIIFNYSLLAHTTEYIHKSWIHMKIVSTAAPLSWVNQWYRWWKAADASTFSPEGDGIMAVPMDVSSKWKPLSTTSLSTTSHWFSQSWRSGGWWHLTWMMSPFSTPSFSWPHILGLYVRETCTLWTSVSVQSWSVREGEGSGTGGVALLRGLDM